MGSIPHGQMQWVLFCTRIVRLRRLNDRFGAWGFSPIEEKHGSYR